MTLGTTSLYNCGIRQTVLLRRSLIGWTLACSPSCNKRVSQMRAPLAACRERAGWGRVGGWVARADHKPATTTLLLWGVKWTFILHLLISVTRISDIGKSFSDIGKSSHFPISVNHRIFRYRKFELPMSEIRISDIGKSTRSPISENHLDLPISENHPIYRYRKFEFPISANHFDFLISVNQSIYRYQKFEFPISVIQHDFPISENQLIYRYRKFDFPISVIQNDFPISVNQLIYRYWKFDFPISISVNQLNSADLPVSENRFTDIGNSFLFSDIAVDFPISEIRITDIGNSTLFSDIGKSTDLPMSEIRITDIGK